MRTTVIRDATVVTVDASRTVHPAGAVVVADDRIVDVGPSEAVLARTPQADEVIDGRGKLVMPGFVSAHNHLGYAVFRGRAEDIGHAPGTRLYTPMAAVLEREERRVIGELAAAELLRGGCTTVLEMEEDADILVPGLERLGMRAAMGIMAHDVNPEKLFTGEIVFDPAERERQLDQAIGLAESCHGRGNGRITAVMSANGLATSSSTLLRSLRETAERLNLRLSVHLGTGDAQSVRATHGAEPFEFAREHGFLDERVVAVHCYKVTDREIELLAESGAHLAHCPHMNQFRGGIAPAMRLREAGVNVGLGIDNYFSDFFEVLRACIAVARIRGEDPYVLPAEEVIEHGTIVSARAMGLAERVGSLEVGKQADLQIVDMRRYGLTPVNDPVRTLVYHGHAKDVDTVMVDGRVVVRGGRVVGEDEDALIEEAGRASDAAWARFVERFGDYVLP